MRIVHHARETGPDPGAGALFEVDDNLRANTLYTTRIMPI